MQEAPPSRLEVWTRPIWFAPFLLALSGTLSYIYADRNMPIPDEGALLTGAAKLLHGGVFYRDVDAYAFPGVSYLLAGLMSIFGEHLSVARTVSGSFFCATVLGVYACAIALIDQKRAALCGLSLLSLKFFVFPIYTMFFYADPSVATAILALALFLRHRFDGASKRLFWVGALKGPIPRGEAIERDLSGDRVRRSLRRETYASALGRSRGPLLTRQALRGFVLRSLL